MCARNSSRTRSSRARSRTRRWFFLQKKIMKQWMEVLEDVRKEYEKEIEILKKTIAELLDMVASLKNRNCELDE